MLLTPEDAAIVRRVCGAFIDAPQRRIGIAVSGGGDSVALMHILARGLGERADFHLFAATVDHGLRAAAAAEARAVAALAGRLGIAHDILEWRGWDGAGNLQARARAARYELLAEWARRRRVEVLALGHTADDQAETVLMRLARSSGVTGLAAMAPERRQDGLILRRPLLGLRRAELRDYLRRNDVPWAEDPGNEDTAFNRIRARRALEVLAPVGITVEALAGVARNMRAAREAIEWHALQAARDLVRLDGGDLLFDLSGFCDLPGETARLLLVRAVQWIGGCEYPPRSQPVAAALAAVRAGETVTLAGCLLRREGGGTLRICREHAAVAGLRTSVGEIWDRRWRLTRAGGAEAGLEVGALGPEGLAAVADWRACGRPRWSLLASPAVWRGDELIAAPLAGMADGWRAEPCAGAGDFFATILSH